MAIVHVTFSESGAGSLMQALATLGCDDRVRPFIDDFSIGPIGPGSEDARAEMLEEVFWWDFANDSFDDFWAEILSPEVTPVAWFSRRDAREYATFHELVWRRGEGSLAFVDVADERFIGRDGRPYPDVSKSFGTVGNDQIVANGLLDRVATVSPNDGTAYRATWQRLRTEDADLRILDETGLTSVPVTVFDSLIESCASTGWQRGARVLAHAITRASDGPFRQAGEMFLWWRICSLVDEGRLEIEGELAPYTCRLRLATGGNRRSPS